jgi:hypothetical protein
LLVLEEYRRGCFAN